MHASQWSLILTQDYKESHRYSTIHDYNTVVKYNTWYKRNKKVKIMSVHWQEIRGIGSWFGRECKNNQKAVSKEWVQSKEQFVKKETGRKKGFCWSSHETFSFSSFSLSTTSLKMELWLFCVLTLQSLGGGLSAHASLIHDILEILGKKRQRKCMALSLMMRFLAIREKLKLSIYELAPRF